MTAARPFISICIPAYNRADLLPVLLESIVTQDFDDYEIVIAEDFSPQRNRIEAVATEFIDKYPNKLRLHLNADNLGYDANFRNLIKLAQGEYCLFLGNDDILAPDSLSYVAQALRTHPNIGVVLRSYSSFRNSPTNVVENYQYFKEELFFPSGPDTVVTFFRRCVVISGLIFNRDLAEEAATAQYDGTLLYQLHLVAHLLMVSNGIFLPKPIALYRLDGIPDFGNSEKEKHLFTPKQQTAASSLNFMRGFLHIARRSEKILQAPIYERILKDLGNYSLPFLAIQLENGRATYIKYVFNLWKLGFSRNLMFYLYAISLFIFGGNALETAVKFIKKSIGYTPALGKLYQGQKT